MEVPYGSVSKDEWIYIVYRHESKDSSQDKGGYVYLPTDVRLTIGDNFQVLADGSVYANNLFLGGTVKDSNMTPASGSLTDSIEADSASGQLAAAFANINTIKSDLVQAKKIEVKNGDTTIFLADGRTVEEAAAVGEVINDDYRVQLGGFTVTNKTLQSQDDTSQVIVGTAGLSLGLPIEGEEGTPFMVHADGKIFASQGTFEGSITADGAILNNTAQFNMAEDTTANFHQIVAKSNISTTSRMNSQEGYYFGTGDKVGFKLEGVQTTEESVNINIAATYSPGATSNRYIIKVTSTKPLADDTTITFSKAV